MATSKKQLAANRTNAKKSRGPLTEATKAKVRLNAKRDGFTGQVTTLSDEDRPVFEKFKSQFIADLAPKTVMELSLADSIAWDTWRLNRLRAVEMNMYALGASDPAAAVECDSPELQTAMSDALTFAKESRTFGLMSIYEQRMNRSIHKNLETLRSLQAVRKAQYEDDRREEGIVAEANDINGLPYVAPTTPSRNGFVFSTAEVLAASNHRNGLIVAQNTTYGAPIKVRFAGATSNAPSALSNVFNWPESDAA